MIDHYEVVKKLIGPICPVGESNIDSERLENIKRLGNLAVQLILDLERAAKYKDSQFHSERVIGCWSEGVLNTIKK